MLFKFRVILDSKEDVFRDIQIKESQNFEDLHKGIINAFDFDGQEMASFYLSNNDWEQGIEISQMDMGIPDSYIMNKSSLHDLAKNIGDKFIYVYDLLNYWTFFVELIDIQDKEETIYYPLIITSVGEMLKEAPEKNFTST